MSCYLERLTYTSKVFLLHVYHLIENEHNVKKMQRFCQFIIDEQNYSLKEINILWGLYHLELALYNVNYIGNKECVVIVRDFLTSFEQQEYADIKKYGIHENSIFIFANEWFKKCSNNYH